MSLFFQHFHCSLIVSQSSFSFFFRFLGRILHPFQESPGIFPVKYRGFFNRTCHTTFLLSFSLLLQRYGLLSESPTQSFKERFCLQSFMWVPPAAARLPVATFNRTIPSDSRPGRRHCRSHHPVRGLGLWRRARVQSIPAVRCLRGHGCRCRCSACCVRG